MGILNPDIVTVTDNEANERMDHLNSLVVDATKNIRRMINIYRGNVKDNNLARYLCSTGIVIWVHINIKQYTTSKFKLIFRIDYNDRMIYDKLIEWVKFQPYVLNVDYRDIISIDISNY